MQSNRSSSLPSDRIVSIDYFRGLTMFLLIGTFTGIARILNNPEFDGTILSFLGTQITHHNWHGLRFWDLIQPYFMYIVGLSMPIAIGKRINRGDSSKSIWTHVLKRSLLLMFLGIYIECVYAGKFIMQTQNVLFQIGFTYFVSFLIMRKSNLFQILFSLGLLILIDAAFRLFPVEGYNQAFTPDKNFGAFIDSIINTNISSGHWTSINAVTTTAHTIWGVLTGYLLISERDQYKKLWILLAFGFGCLLSGYLLDLYTPIIKRIATSSFTLVSGGYSILTMALFFWIIDIKKWNPGNLFFAVIGMNPLFIYLFASVGGARLLKSIFYPFTSSVFFFADDLYIQLINVIISWLGLWYICYFMYKKKVFIRI